MERGARAADRRARAKVRGLNDALGAELPPGIRSEASEEGVVMSGRALRLRFAVEPGLRWILARVR